MAFGESGATNRPVAGFGFAAGNALKDAFGDVNATNVPLASAAAVPPPSPVLGLYRSGGEAAAESGTRRRTGLRPVVYSTLQRKVRRA
ncbi:hypothetical protein GCM10009754_08660 [Amycolatopsis minnesotensis]|uniref:Uncharacterized protein n=1 Tax=Amycolatopsis minnesotensis TaxID=337894 RepID=A0ABN2Q3S8_9PSEU